MQRALNEKEAEIFLEKEGFKLVKRINIKKIEEIPKVEKEIPYPWVMKVNSSKIAHKAKLGGVILNIGSQIKAQEAFEKLEKIENFEEVMIQEQISGEEIIVGIKKTPEFSQVLMFGKGGSKVEEEKDISFRVLPITNKDTNDLIKEINFYRVLQEKGCTIKEIKELILKTGNLIKKHSNITELDINPAIVNSKELKIVDARLILEE